MSLLMESEGVKFNLPATSMTALRQLQTGFTHLRTTPAAESTAQGVEILVQMRAIIDAADTASGWAYKEHEEYCSHGHCLLRFQVDGVCGTFYGEWEQSERLRAGLEKWKKAAEKVPECQERFTAMGLRDWVQVGIVGLWMVGLFCAGFVGVKVY